MIVSEKRVLGFAAAGVIALTAVVVFDSRHDFEGVDPRTGLERAPGLETLDEARATGDARRAAELLAGAGGLAGLAPVREAYAALALELTPPHFAHGYELERALVTAHSDRAALSAADTHRDGARRIALGLDESQAVALARWEAGAEALRARARQVAAALHEVTLDEPIQRCAAAFFVPGWHARSAEGAREAEGIDFEALRVEAQAADDPLLAVPLMVSLADWYEGEARPRAALRWRLRAWRVQPSDATVAAKVFDALVAMRELDAARTVLLASGCAEAPLARRLAQVSAWTDARELEAAALERLAALDAATVDDRSRLVDLYLFAGREALARPHAEALANALGTRASLRLPIQLALECGDVDAALAALAALQQREPSEPYWREEELGVLEEDLRFDALEARLGALARTDPDTYEARYEVVLRRRWRLAPLLALLLARVERGVESPEEHAEALALAHHFDDRRALGRLVELDLALGGDPLRVLERLTALERRGRSDLRPRLEQSLAAGRLTTSDVLRAFEVLATDVWDPRLLQAVLVGARELGADPAVEVGLLSLLDARDPALALQLARVAAARRPSDPGAWSRLATRAAWGGDAALELAARTTLATLALAPVEAVANDEARAQLELEAGRMADALAVWAGLCAGTVAGEPPAAWVVNGLVAASMLADPTPGEAWLRRHVEGRADAGEVLGAAAQQLIERERLGRAAQLFARVLELTPDDPRALLRLAQARSWSDDPRGARAPLERLAALPAGDRTEVRFLLGEVYGAVGEAARARPLFERVVAEYDAASDAEQLWCARALVRLGRTEAGLTALRALVARPGAVPALRVELAEGLLVADAPREASLELAAHLGRRPTDARAQRLLGRAHLALGEREAAIRALLRAVTLEGLVAEGGERSGSGAQLDLAHAFDGGGEWRAARATTHAMLATVGAEPELCALDQDLSERLATLGGALLRYRSVGDDHATTVGVFGSTIVDDEWSRVLLAVEQHDYAGRAAVVDNGATDVAESFASVRLAFDHRAAPERRWAVGAHAFPEAPGGGRVGAWAALRFDDGDAGRWRVDARAQLGDLWAEPFAAVGLGGRTSGLELEGFRALQGSWWTAGGLRTAALSIDDPTNGMGGGEVSDQLFGARVSVGRVLSAHAPRVAEPAAFDRLGPLGFSPYLESRADRDGAALDRDSDHVQVYAGLDHQSLGDGADLATRLPIADEATYFLLGGRIDRLVADGLGGMLEGVAGVELGSGEPALGLDAGATWRPSFGLEVLGRAGVGRALGRADADTEVRLWIGVQLRR